MEAFGWIAFMLIAAIVLAPFALTLLHRFRHRHRRRLVDAPRKIHIAGQNAAEAAEAAARGCADHGHQRDGNRIRHDGRGGYVTTCKRCGARLGRPHGGAWRALDAAGAASAAAGAGGTAAQEGLSRSP
jgi:hypothetical protein